MAAEEPDRLGAAAEPEPGAAATGVAGSDGGQAGRHERGAVRRPARAGRRQAGAATGAAVRRAARRAAAGEAVGPGRRAIRHGRPIRERWSRRRSRDGRRRARRRPGGIGGSSAAGSSVSMGSTGCGKTSTLTFTTVPGESGQNVGTGEGGYVTIQSGGGSRGFAVRLPANYDNNNPTGCSSGFHWNGGTSKDVDTGGSNGYVMAHFGLQKLSNNGAIFVAPQGSATGGRTPAART